LANVLLLYELKEENRILRTASFVGSEGMAPLLVTVTAPQAFAKSRASLNLLSS